MANAAASTGKGFQLKVLGGIAVLSTAMIAIVLLFLETSTISMAAIVLLVGILLSIAYLAIDL